MIYKHLFISSAVLNVAILVFTWPNNSLKTPEEICYVTRCKTCAQFNFKDLAEAQKEFTKTKLQQWYKAQVEDRNSMIRSALLNGYWTSGCTVPPILTEEAKLIPGFAELFDSAK